ncbi:MAG: hypothetical protein A3B38_03875 [Candidatus Levybacteria bacterium RIFCSPLOWO2_01_FULL_36_13]|nr:MAG: hypothetical protein A2684_00810 [Candidatus Levybacteria bacterium RIFCSPHIGHO2_01_FULL_36_15b]OGH34269.1 MAG: hypothetical protein A3B38_03875 [Candidatus Levybacteria bacterium RIFCSPLOWO2_01_FULL_36_13]
MVVYHYSQIDKWNEIVRGSYRSSDQPGLGACRRMGHSDQEAWETSAVFALLDPTPKSWTQNSYFKDIWQWLKWDIGDLLLEIAVDLETDNVFVVDRGHVEGFLYQDKTDIPERFLHSTRKLAERKMMESRISLKDFLAKEEELQYALPEVIFPQHVPLDKIRISNTQPSLEEKARTYPEGWFRDLKIRAKQYVPELSSWINNYECREVSSPSKERR